MNQPRPLPPSPREPRTSDRPSLGARGQQLAASHGLLVAAIALALLARLGFWLYTGRTWEDALITTTHALSAVDGIGLTHHAGEPLVHGFTSPISVLIPLIAEFLWSGSGLIALKAASLVAGAATIMVAYRLSQRLNLTRCATAFFLAYLALNHNHIFYGMTGMETQIAVLLLLASFLAVLQERAIASGLWLGGCLLARPDFVLWVAPALAFFWWRRLRAGLGATLATLALPLPWLLFSTLYYGSPIPNTVVAKSLSYVSRPALGDSWAEWGSWLAERLEAYRYAFWRYFMPFLEQDAVSVVDLPLRFRYFALVAAVFLGLAILGVWSQRRRAGLYPLLGYVLLFSAYRVLFLFPYYFTWYLPPYTAAIALLAAAGLNHIHRYWLRSLAASLAIALAVLYALHLPLSFTLEARIQRQIEDQVRRPLSEYLGRIVQPGEAIASESAGYVGYYSRAKLYDYPGLTSPTVIAALQQLPFEQRTMNHLIRELEPAWLVLRPQEEARLAREFPSVFARYRLEKRYQTKVELAFGGFRYNNIDREFAIFKRQPAAE